MLTNVNFPHLLFLPNLCCWELGSRMKYFRGNNSVREGQSPLAFLLQASQLSSMCFVSRKTSHRANIYSFQDGQSLMGRTDI